MVTFWKLRAWRLKCGAGCSDLRWSARMAEEGRPQRAPGHRPCTEDAGGARGTLHSSQPFKWGETSMTHRGRVLSSMNWLHIQADTNPTTSIKWPTITQKTQTASQSFISEHKLTLLPQAPAFRPSVRRMRVCLLFKTASFTFGSSQLKKFPLKPFLQSKILL